MLAALQVVDEPAIGWAPYLAVDWTLTYLGFHVLFILPPLVVCALLARRAIRRFEGAPGPRFAARARWAPFAVAALALLYTTPWDNYLVYREVWGYGPDRVLGTIGWVPIEEYMFFVLQPLLTGWFFVWLLDRTGEAAAASRAAPPSISISISRKREGEGAGERAIAGIAAGGGVALAALGGWLLTFDAGTYMGLILVWAMPILAGMAWLVAPAVAHWRRAIFTAIAVPTVYLWVADRIAIGLGVWEISDRYTLGPEPLGLPLEEATFFLVTNLMVVLGMVLFLVPGLEPESRPRAGA